MSVFSLLASRTEKVRGALPHLTETSALFSIATFLSQGKTEEQSFVLKL